MMDEEKSREVLLSEHQLMLALLQNLYDNLDHARPWSGWHVQVAKDRIEAAFALAGESLRTS